MSQIRSKAFRPKGETLIKRTEHRHVAVRNCDASRGEARQRGGPNIDCTSSVLENLLDGYSRTTQTLPKEIKKQAPKIRPRAPKRHQIEPKSIQRDACAVLCFYKLSSTKSPRNMRPRYAQERPRDTKSTPNRPQIDPKGLLETILDQC